MIDEIEEFILRRFKSTCADWCNGNCYYFAVILCSRFPFLRIYYEPVMGHFVAGDGINFYDASGKYETEFQPKLFLEIQEEDPIWAERIVKSCII